MQCATKLILTENLGTSNTRIYDIFEMTQNLYILKVLYLLSTTNTGNRKVGYL